MSLEVLQRALHYQQTGQLEQASQLCGQVLATEPANVDALHLLGVVFLMNQRPQEAITQLLAAVAANDRLADVHQHLAMAYQAGGRLSEATASFRKATQLAPDLVDAHHGLGNCLYEQGQWSAARECYELAARLQPDAFQIHFNLANCLSAEGQTDAAMAAYHRAIELNPQLTRAQRNLGLLYQSQQRIEEAEHCFRSVAELEPHSAFSQTQLADLYEKQGRPAEALVYHERAVQLSTANAEPHIRLGHCRRVLADLSGAIASYQQAVVLAPDRGDVFFSLAACQQMLGDFAGAVASYERMLALNPADADARFYCGMVRLAQGDFAAGWSDYEWRRKTRYAEHHFPQPQWDGEPLNGRRILVHAEWGYGDTMHFARYVPLVRERGGAVILAVQPPLVPLLREAALAPVYATDGGELPPCELQIPMLSLPRVFGTTFDSIPAPIPYLRANERLVKLWGERLRELPGIKVGIQWHGARRGWQDDRAIPLAEFEPLSRVAGVTLISLQQDGDDELHAAVRQFPVVELGPDVDRSHGRFMDTAAIIQNLDLVISCDTSVPHLAGALGRPVWVAHMLAAEWRWFSHREDSPWYPTMRLFRQTQWGVWADVFERIRSQLESFVEQRLGDPPGELQ